MVLTVSFVLTPETGFFVSVAGHGAKASSPAWYQRRDIRPTRLRRPHAAPSSDAHLASTASLPNVSWRFAKRPSCPGRDGAKLYGW